MIGKRLKILRENRNLTQTRLGEEIGVVRSQVSMYESDERTPSPDVLVKIAKFFDCSLDYLFGLSDVKESAISYSKTATVLSPEEEEKAKKVIEFIKSLTSDGK